MRFSVGDRVEYSPYGCGIIMYIDAMESIAIDFDVASPGFHGCYGHARAGHGWWVNESGITLPNSCPYDDMVI